VAGQEGVSDTLCEKLEISNSCCCLFIMQCKPSVISNLTACSASSAIRPEHRLGNAQFLAPAEPR
jgi:hypothetical protein